MKLIIAGGREFKRYSIVIDALAKILKQYTITETVSGCARGADKLGERAAKYHGFTDDQIIKFTADWDLYGPKKAGIIRNTEMADYVGEDGILLAFWDGRSTGTKNMIDTMRYRRLPVIVIRY